MWEDINRLDDEDPYVRAVAILALQKFDFQEEWLPRLGSLGSDVCTWVRLETARLFLRELLIPTREALMQMLRDDNTQIRFFGTKLAGYYLAEDLRPALEYCASIKGGGARRNARKLIERLNWQKWAKDPELLKQKKAEARQCEQEKASRKRLRALRKSAKDTIRTLKDAGWESLMVTHVAGSAYVDWEALYVDLEVGERLEFEREPENPHDANAILVIDKEGNKLGYIPAYCNKGLAERLDAGEKFRSILLQVDYDNRVYQLHIEVFRKKQIDKMRLSKNKSLID